MATSEDKILLLLKTRGAQTTAALASALAISTVGARQHLSQLQQRSLVVADDRRETVGRPKRYWQLSPAAQQRFPDSHAVLTLELLNAVRVVFGESGLKKLIAQRERDSLATYRLRLRRCNSLENRIKTLAALRDEEGYMAESRRQNDDSYLLIENHCPICAAALQCQNLCRSELAIFRALFGAEASVERIDHIVAGARRCAYKIEKRSS